MKFEALFGKDLALNFETCLGSPVKGMRSNVNFIPARRDIPPVFVYMEKIIPARRDIPPCRDGMKTARQDGTG